MTDLSQSVEADDGGEDASDKELLEEAKERFKLAEEAWSPNRKAWLDDMRFAAGDHWPEKIKSQREKANRPCLVVDKLNQYRRQVVNDGRQNRPAVKVHPVDGGANEKGAEGFQGLIRTICNQSNADAAFDTALDHAVGGGFGFFRVLTEYASKGTFNQDIRIKRVRNPISVSIDPSFQEADGSDTGWGFIEDRIPTERFKKDYPKAKVTDWESSAYSEGWADEHGVRVCEYWYKVEVPTTLHLLEDGTTVSAEDYALAGQEGVPRPGIVDTREIPTYKVKWCRMSGAEILEKRDWLGQYIPIIPVFGTEQDIEGKVTYSGLIRPGKDPQRLYDFMRTAFAERVALSPKAPNVAAEGQLEGHEDEWENANVENRAVLVYKPLTVDGVAIAAPQRQPASDIPEGFARDMQISEHDIQAALGMYNASLGEKSNEKSGRAIMARQREGDTGTFHYLDNLNRAICYLGKILVDLAPKVIDSRRAVRMMGEDGKATEATIDPSQDVAHRDVAGKAIYNLGIGTYGVTFSAGPSYTTKRQEAAEAQTQLAQAVPQLWQLGGDIIIRNLDWPGADELADRWKLMLPPQILQAEQAQGQDPEVAAVTAQANQALQAKDQQIQAAEAGIHERDQALAKAESAAQSAQLQTDRDRLEAERKDIANERALMQARYAELSAKLELQAMKNAQQVPPVMPPGPEAPVIDPGLQEPHQPPSGGFFTPGDM